MDSRRQHHSNGRQNDHRRHGRGGRSGGGRGGGGYHHHQQHSSNSHNRGSFWFRGEGYNDQDTVSIAEDVVGINGFLYPDQPGFNGQVKQRFSDFVVHEITTSGQRVTLTKLAAKKKPVQVKFQQRLFSFLSGSINECDQSAEIVAAAKTLSRQVLHHWNEQMKQGRAAQEAYNTRKLIALVTSELGVKKGKEFEDFLKNVQEVKLAKKEKEKAGVTVASASDDALVFYIGGLNDKRDRVFLHETMRRYGKSLIIADTIMSDDHSQVIRIRPTTSGPPRKGERVDWPVEQPDYLQFVLYKRNKDTMAVINQIASILKVNTANFSYADVKDKRGITTQLCTVYRVPKERAQGLLRPTHRSLDDQPYLVGDLKYVWSKLSLGNCRGNHFTVAIRGLAGEDELSKEDIQKAVDSWSARGFINFFGLARFGSNSTSYHLLGRAILRKDFKLAVLLLLRPQDGEASKIRQAREHFRQHKDVAAALRMLPSYLISERAVLEGLLQHGIEANELAFQNIPRHLRVAYVESYQNYVWNEMASLRLTKYSSTKAVVGDLVYVKKPEQETKQEVEPPANKRQKTTEETTKPQPELLILTEENVNEYSIEDVVLPLPGHSIIYPNNEISVAYRKMLTTDGVNLIAWRDAVYSPANRPYQLHGSYRHVVQKPTNISFELKSYEDTTQSLIATDVDRLRKGERSTPLTDTVEKSTDTDSSTAATTTDTPKTSGRALVIDFELGYGSDATVALRELMKQSSSVQVQWRAGEEADGSSSKKSQQEPGKISADAGRLKTSRREPTIITAQKKTQVSIGRPGFSLGRS